MFNFKKIFKVVLPLLLVFFSVQPVFASDTVLNDMNIEAVVNDDGSASIKEVWDMDVYEGTEVYKILDNMGESEVKDLSVTDDQDVKYKNIGAWDVDASFNQKTNRCGIVQDDDHYELCFGIGEYGERTYTFTYTITNFVKQYTDEQGLNYAFFSDMDLAPQHVKVTLSSNHEFSSENSAIWGFGYAGTVVYEDGKVVMESEEELDSQSKVQLVMRIDNGTFQTTCNVDESFEDVITDAKEGSDYSDDYDDYDDYDSDLSFWDSLLPFGIIFGSLAVMVVSTMTALYRRKIAKEMLFSDQQNLREKKDIPMFRDIPCQKNLFEFYYLARKANIVDDEDKGGLIAAILLRWIQRGYIQFEKRVEKGLIRKKDGFSIDLQKEIPTETLVEKDLLRYFREAAGDNGLLETKEFEKWCRKNYEKMDRWFDEAETMVLTSYRHQQLLKMGVTHTKFMGISIKRDAEIYDASIRERMEQVIGFKKFLEEMSLIDEKEVIEVKLWEEYLIFASILGIADKVQKQLGKMCPTFNEESEIDTIYTMNMVHTFSYNSCRAVDNARFQAEEAARSSGMGGSSSSFGGGGGFSGGGGGGVR